MSLTAFEGKKKMSARDIYIRQFHCQSRENGTRQRKKIQSLQQKLLREELLS